MLPFFVRHRALSFGLLALLLLGSVWAAMCLGRDADTGKLRVTVLDVGQGDCIVIEVTVSSVTLMVNDIS